MPTMAGRKVFNGADERVRRLGLKPLWEETCLILTDFQLLVREEKDASGGAAVREMIDRRFQESGGWTKSQTGSIDWVKCLTVNGTQVCLGVEVQFSARSDLLIVDVVHLREQITAGAIDVGVLATPSDRLAVFLTDRCPRFSDATRAVERARATDLPLIVVALDHDGPGPALAKRRTRQGRSP